MEEKILKYLYDLFPDIKIFSNLTLPFEDLGFDPEKDALEYQIVFDYLVDQYYVETDKLQISITFSGIFYYEEKYLASNYYYVKAIRIILEFLEKLENGIYLDFSIPNTEVIDELKKEGITMDDKEFYMFIADLNRGTALFKNIQLGLRPQDTINPYIRNKTILTPEGRKFLYNSRIESRLFVKITDLTQKKILLDEYKELQKNIEQGSWKDACIKIGGILEYLLTKWLKNKGVTASQVIDTQKSKDWKDVTFHQMIEFYMNNSRSYSDEIGTYTDWNLVKNILKDYRNYIHLLKYEERVKQGDFLKKDEFDRIYPIFKEIIKKF